MLNKVITADAWQLLPKPFPPNCQKMQIFPFFGQIRPKAVTGFLYDIFLLNLAHLSKKTIRKGDI